MAIEVEKELRLKVGGPAEKLHPTARDAEGRMLAFASFSYTSTDAKVATVDAAGVVKPVGPGKAKVVAKSGEASAPCEVSDEVGGRLPNPCENAAR